MTFDLTGLSFADCEYLTTDPTKCLLFVDDVTSTWIEAEVTCNSLGGQLVRGHHDEIIDALSADVSRQMEKWWIGLRGRFYTGSDEGIVWKVASIGQPTTFAISES